MANLKNILLYSGVSKESYRLIKDDVETYNKNCVVRYSTAAAVIFLALFIASFSEGSVIAKNRHLYLAAMCVFIAGTLLNQFLSERFRLILSFSKYAFVTILLTAGIQLATNSYYDVTATYMVLLFAIPLLLILRPVWSNLIIIISNIIFLIVMHRLEEPELFHKNLVNAIIYGVISIVASNSVNIMKIKKYEADYLNRKLMKTDILTDLLNRHAYNEVLNAHADKPLEPDLIYVAMDLNGLKATNDTLGHEAGDELIKSAARCIRRAMESYGDLFRTGGDEFMAVLHGSEAQVKSAIDDLRKEIAAHNEAKHDDLSISLGYAMVDDLELGTFEELAHLADVRMYQDKEEYYKRTGINRRQR